MSATSRAPQTSTWPERRAHGGARLGLRVRVWAGALRLDSRLAEGVAPASSPELALRARQLSSVRSRTALSNSLASAVSAAGRPYGAWTTKTPIVATGVLEAAPTLQSLARELRTISDPPVRAVALVSFLVCDPTSPLYNRHSAVSVRELATRARSALRR